MSPTPSVPEPAAGTNPPGPSPAQLWVAPRGLTGPQLRAALRCRLSLGRRAAVLGLMFGVALVPGVVVLQLGQDWLVPVIIVLSAFVALRVQLGWMKKLRRQYGLVQATPLQFDLLIAMEQLPAHRIDEGRQLHDALIWNLQQPEPDGATLASIEQHMHHLATTAWAYSA